MNADDKIRLLEEELERQKFWSNIHWLLFVGWMILCNWVDGPRFKKLENDVKQLQTNNQSDGKIDDRPKN